MSAELNQIYFKLQNNTSAWCTVHNRKATHLWAKFHKDANLLELRFHCDPNKGGIMLTCSCVGVPKITVSII